MIARSRKYFVLLFMLLMILQRSVFVNAQQDTKYRFMWQPNRGDFLYLVVCTAGECTSEQKLVTPYGPFSFAVASDGRVIRIGYPDSSDVEGWVLMTLEGEILATYAHPSEYPSGPSAANWSPDDVWLAVSGYVPTEGNDLCLIDIAQMETGGYADCAYTINNAYDPLWSPTGTLLSVIREVPVNSYLAGEIAIHGFQNIYIIDVERLLENKLTDIVQVTPDMLTDCRTLTWLSNHELLAGCRQDSVRGFHHEPPDVDMYLIDLTTNEIRRFERPVDVGNCAMRLGQTEHIAFFDRREVSIWDMTGDTIERFSIPEELEIVRCHTVEWLPE